MRISDWSSDVCSSDLRDFTRRDQNIAKVVPLMARWLPASLLRALGDAVALGALSHALDLRMVGALSADAPTELDAQRYAAAYRSAGDRKSTRMNSSH